MQHEAGRLGEPSIGTMGRKLIRLLCVLRRTSDRAGGAATAPAHAAQKRTLEQGAAQAPGLRRHRPGHLRRAPRHARRRPAASSGGSPARAGPELAGALRGRQGHRQARRPARRPPPRGDARAPAQPRVLARPAAAGARASGSSSTAPSWSGSRSRARASTCTRSANFGKLNAYARNRARSDPHRAAARRAARRGGPARRRARLGVLLHLRRRPRPVDQRPLAGHRRCRPSPARRVRLDRLEELRPVISEGLEMFEKRAADRRAGADRRRRPLRPVLVLARRCASPTASRSRSSASTTWRRSRATRAPQALFAAGDAQGAARGPHLRHRRVVAVLARARSRASPISSYHTLLRDFLANLCDRTAAPRVLRHGDALHGPTSSSRRCSSCARPRLRGAKTGQLRFDARQDLERDGDRHGGGRPPGRADRARHRRPRPAEPELDAAAQGRRLHAAGRGHRPRRQRRRPSRGRWRCVKGTRRG